MKQINRQIYKALETAPTKARIAYWLRISRPTLDRKLKSNKFNDVEIEILKQKGIIQ